MAYTTISNGDKPDADIVMANFTEVKPVIEILYVGTDLNSTVANSTGSPETDTNEYEIGTITGTIDKDYLIVRCRCYSSSAGAPAGLTRFGVYFKEVGGAYGALQGSGNVQNIPTVTTVAATGEMVWIHTLTAGEKANGITIKPEFFVQNNTNGTTVTLVNVQLSCTLSY